MRFAMSQVHALGLKIEKEGSDPEMMRNFMQDVSGLTERAHRIVRHHEKGMPSVQGNGALEHKPERKSRFSFFPKRGPERTA